MSNRFEAIFYSVLFWTAGGIAMGRFIEFNLFDYFVVSALIVVGSRTIYKIFELPTRDEFEDSDG